MVDTVLLLGEMEPGVTGLPPKTPQKAPQPAATAAARAAPVAAAAGAGTLPGTGGAVPLTSAGIPLPLSYPAGGLGAAGQAVGGRRLLDFNSLDDPPKTSAVQWAWLEARLALVAPFLWRERH